MERTMLKTQAVMEFPKGTEDALEDLNTWLREFDRVVAHVSNGRGLMAADRISHLLAAWSVHTDVGENMRMDQETTEYSKFEREGHMEECWRILLRRLDMYRVEPAEARRKAEALWSGLHWPGDIDSFHTLMRRAVTKMKQVHLPKADHEICVRYLSSSQLTRLGPWRIH